MKHNLIQPRAKDITPILASTNPRVGWGVILGFLAAALAIAATSVSMSDHPIYTPFFAITTVQGGAR